MRRGLELGGIVAGIVMIAFGVVAIVMGANGSDTVSTELERQSIVGTPDMTPEATAAAVKEAGLPASVGLPSCDVAEQEIDSGEKARCFADYMRIHALEATGGFTYSEMGRFEAKPDAPKAELAAGGGTEKSWSPPARCAIPTARSSSCRNANGAGCGGAAACGARRCDSRRSRRPSPAG